MKAMYKNELARAAGVSESTFKRWMRMHLSELSTMGVGRHAKLIPARAVQWICQEYGIDEEEL